MPDWTSLLAPGQNRPRSGSQNDYIAQMLMQQGMDQSPIQSPFQGLARMAQAYVGKKRMEADEEKATKGNQVLADLLAPSTAVPSSPQAPVDIGGGLGTIDPSTPAFNAVDPRNAQIADLLNNGIGQETFAKKALTQLGFGDAPKLEKFGKDERGFLPDASSPNGYKQVIDGAPEKIDYNKAFLPDGTPNSPYQEYEKDLRVKGRPQTNVSVNTDKTYAGAMAGKLADNDAAALAAAKDAPLRVQSARNVLRILDTQKPITGTGANTRLYLDKVLATAGIVDGKNVTSTENLASELASQTLDAIKTSGLGSGQGFTDKDRQFLEKAKSGNIELNAGTLHYLARKNEEAGMYAIRRGNEIAKKLKGNPIMGTIGQDLEVPEPEPYNPSGGPAVGHTEDGFRFKGGDPRDKANWEKVTR